MAAGMSVCLVSATASCIQCEGSARADDVLGGGCVEVVVGERGRQANL